MTLPSQDCHVSDPFKLQVPEFGEQPYVFKKTKFFISLLIIFFLNSPCNLLSATLFCSVCACQQVRSVCKVQAPIRIRNLQDSLGDHESVLELEPYVSVLSRQAHKLQAPDFLDRPGSPRDNSKWVTLQISLFSGAKHR